MNSFKQVYDLREDDRFRRRTTGAARGPIQTHSTDARHLASKCVPLS